MAAPPASPAAVREELAALACAADDDLSGFEQTLRARSAKMWGAGPCALDVSPQTIRMFSQGSYALLQADLRALLPLRVATAAEELLVAHGVPVA
jgi:hypothetical protein